MTMTIAVPSRCTRSNSVAICSPVRDRARRLVRPRAEARDDWQGTSNGDTCISPPESSDGPVARAVGSPTYSSSSSVRRRRASRGIRASACGSSMFLPGCEHRKKKESLEDKAQLLSRLSLRSASGSELTSPILEKQRASRRRVYASRICRSVDLPQPDGPHMATYSAGSIRSRHSAYRGYPSGGHRKHFVISRPSTIDSQERRRRRHHPMSSDLSVEAIGSLATCVSDRRRHRHGHQAAPCIGPTRAVRTQRTVDSRGIPGIGLQKRIEPIDSARPSGSPASPPDPTRRADARRRSPSACARNRRAQRGNLSKSLVRRDRQEHRDEKKPEEHRIVARTKEIWRSRRIRSAEIGRRAPLWSRREVWTDAPDGSTAAAAPMRRPGRDHHMSFVGSATPQVRAKS